METKSLVIVESPSKAKTINKYLGKNFKVEASVGHIIDLPKSKFGVSIEQGFKPQYIKIRGKEKIIKHLKSTAAKADKIYLATDPDREGEAIAYHIFSILERDKKDVKRVEFNEITKQAITEAFETPREIDMAMVYSQQARRVLDRIVGYQVSPILWKTIYRGLSAGRVQSVALRLICEREESIRQFTPEEYWTIKILVRGKPETPFWAKLVKIQAGTDQQATKAEIRNEAEASGHVERIKKSNLSILDLNTKRLKKTPGPPFITSTLQQTAARLLRYSTSRIMRIAQQLYEGVEIPGKDSVGLITYMRTDSTRISNEAIQSARQMIQHNYGKEYLPEHARHYRSKKSAQDAHEAIRPTYLDADYNPEKLKKHLSPEQYKLYDLIWKRFVACQMQEALFDKTVVDVGGNEYLFRAEGETMVFDGYLKVYGATLEKENGEDNEPVTTIPAGLHKHEPLQLQDIDSKQNFTKPPARFMESSLVKELDRLGIGRPSTYAQIIYTILARKYVEKKENKLWATELGETVNKILVNNFPDIFNVTFTAEMEDELDKIAAHKLKYEEVMHNFYQPFTVSMQKAQTQREQIKSELQEETNTVCDLCGKPMIIRWGRNGRFMACSGYPDCKNTKPLNGEEEPRESNEVCEKCGNPMIYKIGRYGRFLACSDYPTCKNTKAIPLGIKCPKPGCGGDVIQRRSKKGKLFYGCSRYPNCDFVSWDKPVNSSCSSCGHPYLLEKYSKAKGNFLLCPECKTSSVVIKNEA
jgi:DNA topoisomerase-1